MGVTLRENQYLAIISHGPAADALVQQLCAAAPALRWVRSVTGAHANEVAQWVAQLQPQALLGAVVYVVERADAQALALLGQHQLAMQAAAVPVLTVVVDAAPGGQTEMAALRAQTDGLMVLQAPSTPDGQSAFTQLLHLDAALQMALNVDTTINLHVEDIVACMCGVQSRMHVKPHQDGLHEWMAQVVDQCQDAPTPIQKIGVFTQVHRSQPLKTARAIQQALAQGLPQAAPAQLCTWYADPAGHAVRSFAIASY